MASGSAIEYNYPLQRMWPTSSKTVDTIAAGAEQLITGKPDTYAYSNCGGDTKPTNASHAHPKTYANASPYDSAAAEPTHEYS